MAVSLGDSNETQELGILKATEMEVCLCGVDGCVGVLLHIGGGGGGVLVCVAGMGCVLVLCHS